MGGGGGDMGGHVLRETTSRGLCGLVCPSRTSERGGEGDCVKEGGGGEGKCERERALERLRCVCVCVYYCRRNVETYVTNECNTSSNVICQECKACPIDFYPNVTCG
jgi:hypothetical protein